MNTTLVLPKFPLQALGVILILLGLYLMFDVYSFSKSRSYISSGERWKRVFRSGTGAVAFAFGMLFLVFMNFLPVVTLGNVFSILSVGLCFSPVAAFLTGLRRYRDLWMFTKTEDDVVFLDEDANPKS